MFIVIKWVSYLEVCSCSARVPNHKGTCATHQGGLDADALSRLESQGQIPALQKNKQVVGTAWKLLYTSGQLIMPRDTQAAKEQQTDLRQINSMVSMVFLGRDVIIAASGAR